MRLRKRRLEKHSKLAKGVRILRRTVRWHPGDGVANEVDPRHVATAVKEAGASGAKTLSSRGEKSESKVDINNQDDSDGELLDSARASAYRSVAARMNYLNVDRPDIALLRS